MPIIFVSLQGIERQLSLTDCSIEGLHTSIPSIFPCLASHVSELGLRYVDDEGDIIIVTTTDELQEALDVGAIDGGALRLNLVLPERLEGKVVPAPLPSETTSTGEAPAVQVQAQAQAQAEPKTPEVLAVLHEAGATAIAGVNQAIGSASAEISKMFTELSQAAKKRADADAQIAATTAQLADTQSELKQATTEIAQLREQIETSEVRLKSSVVSQQASIDRITVLEAELKAASSWEAKYHAAEAQRLSLSKQLASLRAGLLNLTSLGPTSTTSAASTAEIVSSEMVPSSPAVQSVSSDELPPPYPSVQLPPHDESPPVVPPRSEPEQKEPEEHEGSLEGLDPSLQPAMKLARDLGFHLSPEEVQSRYSAADGNLEVLANGLFS